MKRFGPWSFNAALLAVCVSLLCGSGCEPKPPEHGVTFLVALDTNLLSSAADLDHAGTKTGEVLRKRAASLGTGTVVTPQGQGTFRLTLASTNDTVVTRARRMLGKAGSLEFRLVHPESDKLLKEGFIPPGYEIKKEMCNLPNGEKIAVPFLLGKRSLPGISGQAIQRASVVRGSQKEPQIKFQFKADGAKAFADITSQNIGRQLGIVIDGELISAPVIQGAITGGSGVISGGSMSQQEVLDLAEMLQNSLEVPVRIMEERRF